jgi:hypothetical protein
VKRLNIRSAVLLVVFLAIFFLAILNLGRIPTQFHIPVFVGLAILGSLVVLAIDVGEKLSGIRLGVAIVNMVLVTAVYLSYLERDVVIASFVITLIATAVTYYRVAKEMLRRRQV